MAGYEQPSRAMTENAGCLRGCRLPHAPAVDLHTDWIRISKAGHALSPWPAELDGGVDRAPSRVLGPVLNGRARSGDAAFRWASRTRPGSSDGESDVEIAAVSMRPAIPQGRNGLLRRRPGHGRGLRITGRAGRPPRSRPHRRKSRQSTRCGRRGANARSIRFGGRIARWRGASGPRQGGADRQTWVESSSTACCSIRRRSGGRTLPLVRQRTRKPTQGTSISRAKNVGDIRCSPALPRHPSVKSQQPPSRPRHGSFCHP